MKIRSKLIISLIAVCVIALIWGSNAVAEKSSISSVGNLDFNNGTVTIYAEDIEYLQNEIVALYNEISN